MRIDLEMVKLHEDLFFGKTNLGNKIHKESKLNKNAAKVEIYYDTEGTGKWTKEEHIVIEWGNRIAIVPMCAHKEFVVPSEKKETKVQAAIPETAFGAAVVKKGKPAKQIEGQGE